MIWFSCKKCGKVHGRTEGSIGTTIFCDCGQGVIVPWESNATEPEKPAEGAGAPRLKPMTFDAPPPPPLPRPERPERERPDRLDRERPERDRLDRDRDRSQPGPRRDRRGPRDPNACLNHEHRVKQNTCADCGEGFCPLCLVTFQGKPMCGPCKNFRARLLQKPLRTPIFAWMSLALALVLGPLAMCILPLGVSSWTVLWTFLALLPQAAAVMLAVAAWRSVEQDPGMGGRGLAITGMITGGLTALLIVLLNFYGGRWHGAG